MFLRKKNKILVFFSVQDQVNFYRASVAEKNDANVFLTLCFCAMDSFTSTQSLQSVSHLKPLKDSANYNLEF